MHRIRFGKTFRTCRNVLNDRSYDELGSLRIKTSKVYRGVRYNNADEDPVPQPESVRAGIGVDTKEEINVALRNMLMVAEPSGMTKAGFKKLGQILQDNRDIFRIKLGTDPPAKLPPLSIQLRNDDKPFRAPKRRYGPHQRDFTVDTIRNLEALGAVFKSPSARWPIPALAVAKTDSEKLRFTVDLRGPNAQTEPIVSSMLHLNSEIQTVEGSNCFAKADMVDAYWKIPLDEESHEIMSIQTPVGVYSSERLLQGNTDAGNHFQAVTSEIFNEIARNMLQWLDGFLLHARSEAELLRVVDLFMFQRVWAQDTCRKINMFHEGSQVLRAHIIGKWHEIRS